MYPELPFPFSGGLNGDSPIPSLEEDQAYWDSLWSGELEDDTPSQEEQP